MRLSRPLAALVLAAGAVAGLSRPVAAKDKPPAEKPTPGTSKLTVAPPTEYVYMAVPKDYDAKRWYPLVFLLHSLSDDPANSKPEPFVAPWAEILLPRGWIIAAPKSPVYDNETTAGPLMEALKKVLAVYHVDDRRVVVVGHNAGGCMAWNVATKYPAAFAAVASFSGEIRQENRPGLKGLAGRKAYIFRGGKDTYYTAPMLKFDKALVEAAKLELTVHEKADWDLAMPVHDLAPFVDWLEKVYPPGTWKEKADAAEKALAAKDFPGAAKALADLAAELKKAPYPAFEQRAAAIQAAMVSSARDLFAAAQQVAEADPADALAKMEAALKAVKGVKALEDEAKKAQAALLKVPAVAEAVKKVEAEAAGASFMEKAAAAEAKGDLAQALALYRKAAALALFSKKNDAAAKITELEPKVGAK